MKLSADQIGSIRAYVEDSGIEIESLKADIVDHLCCAVEIKMERKQTFDNGLSEAIHELAPDGLYVLQNETVFLLNSTKIIFMKKVMFATGLLSTMAFALGWTFGILHLPGSFELSAYGFLGFAFIFLPLYAIDYYKASIQRALSEKLRFIFGLMSATFLGASVALKMNHIEGGSLLLAAGTAVFVFGFLPFLFFGMYKKSVS